MIERTYVTLPTHANRKKRRFLQKSVVYRSNHMPLTFPLCSSCENSVVFEVLEIQDKEGHKDSQRPDRQHPSVRQTFCSPTVRSLLRLSYRLRLIHHPRIPAAHTVRIVKVLKNTVCRVLVWSQMLGCWGIFGSRSVEQRRSRGEMRTIDRPWRSR